MRPLPILPHDPQLGRAQTWPAGCRTRVVACLLFTAFLSCTSPALAQDEGRDSLIFRVVEYNVENLFDCHDDSLYSDEEFLPTSVRHWTYSRYRKKLDKVARAIVAAGNGVLPVLVALCEVENDSVLHDLTCRSILRTAGYHYLMTHSSDPRGIDVALLYQRYAFRPLITSHLRISPPRGGHPTRDILHVSGLLLSGDTLDVYVVHFPSRSGGARETENYRLNAAHRLRASVDSVMRLRHHPQVLIMGDFNDYPQNASIRRVLEAGVPPEPATDTVQPRRLYHLLANKAATRRRWGSYKYQGVWGLLDHIIVSGTLLQPYAPLRTSPSRADVLMADFLLTDDMKQGGRMPLRTYYGMKYLGGYSDHLPIWAEFTLYY